MTIAKWAAAFMLVVITRAGVFAQSPSSPVGPSFDVVSVKRNTSNTLGSNVNERADGGFTMTNIPVGTLIARAYQAAPVDMVNLPGWAMSDRYDVSTTSSLSAPTPEQRAIMLKAMLADRFKFAAHVENREQPAYDLLLARSDGRLGPGMKPFDVDCAAKSAADRAAAEAARAAGQPPPRPSLPDLNGPVPPCTFFMRGDTMEGSSTIANLANMLRPAAGRFIVDKTGLTGSHYITMTFDRMAGLRGPATTPSPTAAPSVFTAVQEQLGLKLESSKAVRETLVIDRLERPTDN